MKQKNTKIPRPKDPYSKALGLLAEEVDPVKKSIQDAYNAEYKRVYNKNWLIKSSFSRYYNAHNSGSAAAIKTAINILEQNPSAKLEHSYLEKLVENHAFCKNNAKLSKKEYPILSLFISALPLATTIIASIATGQAVASGGGGTALAFINTKESKAIASSTVANFNQSIQEGKTIVKALSEVLKVKLSSVEKAAGVKPKNTLNKVNAISKQGNSQSPKLSTLPNPSRTSPSAAQEL